MTSGFFFGGLPNVPTGGGNSPVYGGNTQGGNGTLPTGNDDENTGQTITYEIEDTNVLEGDKA